MRILVPAVLLGLPGVARAHLVSTGVGPFYDGLAHLYLTPPDLLFCIAMGLLGGLMGRADARALLLSGGLVWYLGALLGLALVFPAAPFLVPSLLLIAGVLTATRGPPAGHWTRRVTLILAVLMCAAHGSYTGAAFAVSGLTTVTGYWSAFMLTLLLVTAGVASLEPWWARVAVRVAGSWLAAVGLLILGALIAERPA